MGSLAACRLYAILDLGYVALDDAARVTESLLAGGVDAIQIRAKQFEADQIAELASRLHDATSRTGVPLIVNDHPEIARVVPVEGVHLGQDDISLMEARRIIGRDCWLGKSTHSRAQAVAAAAEGADYIGFGPLFATATKPDYEPIGLEDLGAVNRDLTIPVFCIGGIKLNNLAEVVAAGGRRAVIVSGLLQAGDIAGYARAARKLLVAAEHPIVP